MWTVRPLSESHIRFRCDLKKLICMEGRRKCLPGSLALVRRCTEYSALGCLHRSAPAKARAPGISRMPTVCWRHRPSQARSKRQMWFQPRPRWPHHRDGGSSHWFLKKRGKLHSRGSIIVFKQDTWWGWSKRQGLSCQTEGKDGTPEGKMKIQTWHRVSPWAFDKWSSRPGCRQRGESCWGEPGGRRSSRWRSRTRTRSDPREKTTWKRQIQSLLWDLCLSCDVLTGKLDIYCRYVPGFMKLALGGLPI